MAENRLERTRSVYLDDAQPPFEIKAIYQMQGGSDSGGIWRSQLKIINIYRTPEGLVIEVE